MTTSMYSGLLRAAGAEWLVANAEATDADLGAQLIRRGEGLRQGPAGGPVTGGPVTGGAVTGLAAEIDYDLVLMQLCQRVGIPCGPEGFVRPAEERRRLEMALAAVNGRPGRGGTGGDPGWEAGFGAEVGS